MSIKGGTGPTACAKFELRGERLKGNFVLVHWKEKSWLLMKEAD